MPKARKNRIAGVVALLVVMLVATVVWTGSATAAFAHRVPAMNSLRSRHTKSWLSASRYACFASLSAWNVHGNADSDRRSVAGRTLDLHVTSAELRSFFHAQETQRPQSVR